MLWWGAINCGFGDRGLEVCSGRLDVHLTDYVTQHELCQGGKLIFGQGTKLFVKPSKYKIVSLD